MQNEVFQNKEFLQQLANENIQTYFAKIVVLNSKELPIREITGKILPGSSININGNSAIRRTCNLTFLADEYDNDLTNVNNLLSINKRIKIEVGIENNINSQYDDIIWFKQGIFIICQPSISNTNSGVKISLSCKDKMCLLNGECGGKLPAPITFDSYDQVLPDGSIVSIPQTMYDIIQTLVCNYGGEPISKIFINDLPLEIKQIVRYIGSNPLYYNSSNGKYTLDESAAIDEEGSWQVFNYNENIGYIYTDFIYPGELQSGIGDNICSVLDKIKNVLGNYEYFYDIDGNFVFQEIKNYLNNSYLPIEVKENNSSILDKQSYKMDIRSNTNTVYNFEQGNGLISSYSNTPVYSNIKNDFHIWGKNDDGFAIHYHIVIKEKPFEMNKYFVIFLKNEDGEYNGRLRLADTDEINAYYKIINETLIDSTEDGEVNTNNEIYNNSGESSEVIDETLILANGGAVVEYIPEDWRAELYLQGLTKRKNDIRPDIYEQELLDLFDSIYNFKEKSFKTDITRNPNALKYFIDYLEPSSNLFDISVDSISSRVHSYQQDNIKRLYDRDIPNYILIPIGEDNQNTIDRCSQEGQPYSQIEAVIYSKLASNVVGYSAHETARDLLYQYTHYNESISIQSRPIYYLEPNTRISVNDRLSGISGDYVISTITLPLDASNFMSINAIKVVDRI